MADLIRFADRDAAQVHAGLISPQAEAVGRAKSLTQ